VSGAPVWAVVPVKPFHLAKTRLASLLEGHERARLAQLMFEDVLSALAGSRRLFDGVIVSTADERAAAVAREFGATVLLEAAPTGLNRAVGAAAARLARVPGASMVVIPSDLPQLTHGAVEQLAALLDAPKAVALVEATGDGGTNVLGCRPAAVIEPQFGRRSFAAHHRAARAAGVTHLGNDLDRPDDLLTFLQARTPTRTHSYLTDLGIEERLSCSMSS
jgi:2-phospho-L-lactate/phosphoenolpyruvate guanylyltransferase